MSMTHAEVTRRTLQDSIRQCVSVHSRDDGSFAVDIPLTYPDGDQCRVFVSPSSNGKWNVSDGGSSVMRASYAGNVDVLSARYIKPFLEIIRLHGLSADCGEVSRKDVEDIGGAVFAVAQASLEIIRLAGLPPVRRSITDRLRDMTERLERGEPIPCTLVREVETPDGPMHEFERGTIEHE